MSNNKNPIAELSPQEKRALLAQLLMKRAGEPRSAPLSFAQQRLWFLNQLDPDSPAYNIPCSVRLNGWLNVKALKRALSEIVGRHEILRTTFTAVDGEPMQVVHATRPVSLPVADLSGLELPNREAEALHLAAEEARRPFDFTQGPLMRAMLLRLGEQEHVVLLTTHHIVSDAWSLSVLAREVSALYEAFSQGHSSPLAELAIQYADYSIWQRAWLQGEVFEEQLLYWKQQLNGAPNVLEFPTDKPRPATQTFKGATESLLIPKPLADAIENMSRLEGVTLFASLLTVFNILLHYYVSSDDIVVGTDVANRNRLEIEPLIGLFVSQLVLRTNLSSNPTFRGILNCEQKVVLEAYSHQELPFEKLVEVLRPERSLSRNPLFQVMFCMQNGPTPELDLYGLTASPLKVENVTSVFDFSFFVRQTGQGLATSVRYNTDLFEAGTIRTMLRRFEILLRNAVIEPEARLKNLEEKLAEAERRRRSIEEQQLENISLNKLKWTKRKSVNAPQPGGVS